MDNATFMGYLVIGLVSLIGLFMTVAKPIIALNKTLIELSTNMKFQKGLLEEHDAKIDSFDKQIDNHEYRITTLEKHVQ